MSLILDTEEILLFLILLAGGSNGKSGPLNEQERKIDAFSKRLKKSVFTRGLKLLLSNFGEDGATTEENIQRFAQQ